MMAERLYRYSVFIVVIMLAVLVFSPLAASQTNAPNIRMHLSGPVVIGTLRSGTYAATIVDPQNREWEYTVYISSSNTSGATPLQDSPITGNVTSEDYTFTFEVTGQQKPGELEININCTYENLYYHKIQKISVVAPISLSVEVTNPSNVVVNNATVQFFVNDSEIDKQVIPSIGASQTITVSSEWIEKDKKPGWHTSKIVIDLNGDGIIDTNAGDMIIEDRFYVEGSRDWVFALTVIVGLIALIIGFGFISKKKMK